MVVRSFGVLSVGKVQGVMGAIFGLLAGGMFTLLVLAGIVAGGGGGIEAIFVGIAAIVGLPIFYGAMGFIGGALSALIYNLLAGTVGGIEIQFDQPENYDDGL